MALYRIQHGKLHQKGPTDQFSGGTVNYVEADSWDEAFKIAQEYWGKGKMDVRLATEQERRREERRLNHDVKVHPILDRRLRRDRRINTLPSARRDAVQE